MRGPGAWEGRPRLILPEEIGQGVLDWASPIWHPDNFVNYSGWPIPKLM